MSSGACKLLLSGEPGRRSGIGHATLATAGQQHRLAAPSAVVADLAEAAAASDAPPGQKAQDPAGRPMLGPGTQLKEGQYRLGGQLHQGPRSCVFAAADAGGQPVAIKVLEGGTLSAQRRALHEVQLMQRLAAVGEAAAAQTALQIDASGGNISGRSKADGPSTSGRAASSCSTASGSKIAPLLDWFHWEGDQDGAVCLVLPPLYQSAGNVLYYLGTKGRRGLPLPAVRNLARQLLEGLDELHRRHGLVHRDVKPSNLLLAAPFFKGRSDSGAGRQAGAAKAAVRTMSQAEIVDAPWRLIDFGNAAPLVARWPWQRPEAEQPLVYDTPAYAPPEVLLRLPSTAAHDIWSAGCVIYEAATGRPLFDPEPAEGEPYTADERHLWQIKQLLGAPPLKVLDRSRVSDAFYDARGLLHLEQQFPLRPLRMRQLLTEVVGMEDQEAAPLADFLTSLLEFDPDRRASGQQALAHPWLKQG